MRVLLRLHKEKNENWLKMTLNKINSKNVSSEKILDGKRKLLELTKRMYGKISKNFSIRIQLNTAAFISK